MKHLVFLFLFALSMSLAAQNPFPVKPKPAPAPPEEIHTQLEDMPQFPGGPEAMQKYLEDHISHPAIMRGVCSGRRLIVGFVVEKDGSLSQVDIIKSINGCPDFDFDVLKIVKAMPRWIPGKLEGHYVRCFYKMPVYIN
jgi:protein TonB